MNMAHFQRDVFHSQIHQYMSTSALVACSPFSFSRSRKLVAPLAVEMTIIIYMNLMKAYILIAIVG